MKITGATILDNNGNTVETGATITSIEINGSTVYISYVDGSNNLKASKAYLTSAGVTLATGCTVVS